MSILSFLKRKPRKLEISLLNRDANIRLDFSMNVYRQINRLINVIEEKSKKPSEYTFQCKGANTKCEEITVIKRGNQVDCPRLQKELEYLEDNGSRPGREMPYMCYCGDLDKKIPIVKKEDFLEHKIHECFIYKLG